ncbi:MAG TPA: helix-turn-helix domain-containing protein, partial [Paenibacillus sp.]|nr:helix-turn-helix domain-containing protein [Paenibacillus sp.]
EHVTARDRQLYQYAYVKLARELLEGQEGAFAASESERRLLLIWCADRERVTDTYLQSFASRMQETYRKYLKRTVTIGIGEPAEGPEELYRGYRQALHALELRALLPPGSIVPYASVSPQALEREPDHPMVGKELFLLSEIRAGHGEHVRKALSELEPMLRSLPWGELRKAAYRIFLYIRRLSLETAQPDEPDDPFDPKDAAQATRAEELVRLVADYATFVCAKVEKIKEQPSYRMIAEAKAWIKERLDEEITLQRLSERFHIHPKYFSQRFKQATGETYMDYITRVRFDKAKELLVAGDLKVAGVAERVGFADANYFSIAFKKYTGYTPSEYRERHRA